MIQEKFQVTWKPFLKLTLPSCGFLSFEKDKACQSILIILCEKIALKITWSKKESLMCAALFYLKYLKFIFLEIFLLLFMLDCKDYQ